MILVNPVSIQPYSLKPPLLSRSNITGGQTRGAAPTTIMPVDRLLLERSGQTAPTMGFNRIGSLIRPETRMALNQGPAVGTVTLDLLTLNVFSLTKPIGKDIEARTARVGKTLGGYDIVGLQEMFSRDSKALDRAAATAGLHFNRFKPSPHRLTNSGLQIMAKYPIVETDFIPFQYSSHADALAKKGVAFARLNVPGIGFVDVYTTHYQAEGDKKVSGLHSLMRKVVGLFLPGYEMSKDLIRMHDNQILEQIVKKHDKGYPTFIMGDFNTRDDRPVYRDLVSRLGVKDSFKEINPNDPGYTSDGLRNPLKGGSTSQSRIDFIFYKPGQGYDVRILGSQLAYDEAIEGKFVSDHFGVHTRFQITRQ